MRKITVYQKGSSNIELFDDSDMSIDECCHELSKLFQANNIAMIKTSGSVFLLRPSKLNGINVEDIEIKEITEEPQKEPEKPKNEKIQEDIITDMD